MTTDRVILETANGKLTRNDAGDIFIYDKVAQLRDFAYDLAAELDRLAAENVLLQASNNGLRLPQVGWQTGKTIDELESTLAKLDQQRTQLIADSAETDDAIRKACATVLPKGRVYGDSEFVPSAEDLVDEVCGIAATRERELSEAVGLLRKASGMGVNVSWWKDAEQWLARHDGKASGPIVHKFDKTTVVTLPGFRLEIVVYRVTESWAWHAAPAAYSMSRGGFATRDEAVADAVAWIAEQADKDKASVTPEGTDHAE